MDSSFARPSNAELVEQYRRSRERITELVAEVGSDVAGRRVAACPDWSVAQLLAHVVGLATEISSGNMPGADSQGWVDAIVASRSTATVDDLIAEWASSGPAFESLASENARLAVPLSYDLVVHEHDLRHALESPGERNDPGVLTSMWVGALLLDGDLKKNSAGSLHLVAGGHEWTCGDGDVLLSLDLDRDTRWSHPVWELLRLTGSRRSLGQLSRYAWDGDFAALAPSMFHMDLPVDDIDE
jgi:uncharacterized protein (TIGR03083 family)